MVKALFCPTLLASAIYRFRSFVPRLPGFFSAEKAGKPGDEATDFMHSQNTGDAIVCSQSKPSPYCASNWCWGMSWSGNICK